MSNKKNKIPKVRPYKIGNKTINLSSLVAIGDYDWYNCYRIRVDLFFLFGPIVSVVFETKEDETGKADGDNGYLPILSDGSIPKDKYSFDSINTIFFERVSNEMKSLIKEWETL